MMCLDVLLEADVSAFLVFWQNSCRFKLRGYSSSSANWVNQLASAAEVVCDHEQSAEECE